MCHACVCMCVHECYSCVCVCVVCVFVSENFKRIYRCLIVINVFVCALQVIKTELAATIPWHFGCWQLPARGQTCNLKWLAEACNTDVAGWLRANNYGRLFLRWVPSLVKVTEGKCKVWWRCLKEEAKRDKSQRVTTSTNKLQSYNYRHTSANQPPPLTGKGLSRGNRQSVYTQIHV